jgi:hypothetical protein
MRENRVLDAREVHFEGHVLREYLVLRLSQRPRNAWPHPPIQ